MSSYNGVTSGRHLGVMRSWIQREAANGEQVTWSSRTPLRFMHHLSCADLEALAQDIRDAVLNEFHVKDHDYEYRYVLSCDEGCAAFQDFDTFEEMWAKLYKSRGRVMVMVRATKEWIFHGTTDEARAWCLEQRDKKE